MFGAWARLRAWRHRHPLLTAGGLVALTVILGWAGYRGGWHLWARSQFRAAQQAADRFAWEEAREQLQESLRGSPDNPEAHLLAARAARRLEHLVEAEKHLEACRRLQGGETQATRVEGALIRVYRGELAEVEGFLRDCVARDDPDAVEILDVLSAALILNYRVAEAEPCLAELLRRRPDHFHALVRRGWVARSLTWYPQAAEYYGQALALRPDVDTVRLALAEVLAALGRTADAQEHFEQLRARQPDNASVLFGLAHCLATRDRPAEAQALFDRLLTEHPDDWQALGERGQLALSFGRPAEAEDFLRRAAALAPADLPILTRLANCLRQLGKDSEAAEYQARADRLQADFQRAEQLGTLIRQQSPNDPALRHELGALLLRLGKPQDAQHWFQTALEKDPGYRPAHQSLAELYEQSGDPNRAARHREALRRLDREVTR